MTMEEWNQWHADSRGIDTMRRIALGALEIEDNDEAFWVLCGKTLDESTFRCEISR